MSEPEVITYTINNPVELNLSYMPFIKEGGLFIPTNNQYSLGTKVTVNLKIPASNENITITGVVIWITPKNALHHVLPGIGIQFVDPDAKLVQAQVKKHLDPTMEMGGYTYGIMEERSKKK
jgi:type IV pilus assembly protein PilZ